MDIFYRALGNLKTSRNELEGSLDSVKKETENYYEKVEEAQGEIATIEKDVNISAADFEPDVYEADVGVNETLEAENLNETDVSEEAERVPDGTEETAEAEQTNEDDGEAPEILPEVEL